MDVTSLNNELIVGLVSKMEYSVWIGLDQVEFTDMPDILNSGEVIWISHFVNMLLSSRWSLESWKVLTTGDKLI